MLMNKGEILYKMGTICSGQCNRPVWPHNDKDGVKKEILGIRMDNGNGLEINPIHNFRNKIQAIFS